MKKVIVFLAVIISMSCFGQEDWATLNQENYSIQYPKEWGISDEDLTDKGFQLFLNENANEDFNEGIALTIQNHKDKELTFEKFTEIAKKEMKLLLGDNKYRLLQDKVVTKNGQQANYCLWYMKVAGKRLKVKQYLFFKDGIAYSISYKAPRKTFNKHVKVADKILDTFIVK